MSVTAFTGLMFLRGVELIEALPVASGVVISVGDMLKLSGGNVLAVAASTDDLTFIGVAKEAHASTDPALNLSVALRNAGAVYLATLDAATSMSPGDLLQLLSGGCIKLKKSATDPVAMAVQKTSSGTTCEVVLLLPNQAGSIRLVGDAS